MAAPHQTSHHVLPDQPYSPDPALGNSLAAGDPPVYLGFGGTGWARRCGCFRGSVSGIAREHKAE